MKMKGGIHHEEDPIFILSFNNDCFTAHRPRRTQQIGNKA